LVLKKKKKWAKRGQPPKRETGSVKGPMKKIKKRSEMRRGGKSKKSCAKGVVVHQHKRAVLAEGPLDAWLREKQEKSYR